MIAAYQGGDRPNERLEIDSLEAIAIMVSRGLGVTLLPDWASLWLETLRLRKIAIPDPSLRRRVGLLWRLASLRDGVIRAFLQEAQDELAETKPRQSSRAKSREKQVAAVVRRP